MAGGGPAGAAVALLLARAGRQVCVFEREPASGHKVCGEFIGGDALALLAELGIDVAALGGAAITRLRLLRAGRRVEAALPFPALGLSRRKLDAALLRAAGAAGAQVVRGHAARRLRPGVLELDRLPPVAAPALFLATGKHDLRGAARAAGRAADTVAFKLHLGLAPDQARALAGAIELLLWDDSYAGLQPIEDGAANLCLVTPRTRLQRAGGWDGLLDGLCRDSPHLAARLRGARGWDKPLAIAAVPYGFIHRAAAGDAGIFRLGDQLGVIHSFTGDGIAIALHTARLAARCFLAGASPAAYHARAAAEVAGPIRLSCALYRAGRRPPVQAAMIAAAGLWPGALGLLAGLTRAGWRRAA